MTVVGVVTTIGLFLALGYLLKNKADHRVLYAWLWLFLCLLGSTAAVTNQVPSDKFIYWYGVPALGAVAVLIMRFWGTMDWLAGVYIGIFAGNVLGLHFGLHRAALGLGVNLLTVTVWAQVALLFLMGSRRKRPLVEMMPPVRAQPKYGEKDNHEPPRRIGPPADSQVWWWYWVESAWRTKYADTLSRRSSEARRHNGG